MKQRRSRRHTPAAKEPTSVLINIEGHPAAQLHEIKARTGIPLKRLGALAVEYFAPAIESGELRIVNGQLERAA